MKGWGYCNLYCKHGHYKAGNVQIKSDGNYECATCATTRNIRRKEYFASRWPTYREKELERNRKWVENNPERKRLHRRKYVKIVTVKNIQK